MHDAGVDVGGAQRADRLHEALRLDLEIGAIWTRISRGELRERADQLERTVETDLMHERDHLVEAHPDAVHARVDSQMEGGAHPHRIGGSAYWMANSAV